MNYHPYAPRALFYVSPQGLLRCQLLGRSSWKLSASLTIDAQGNVAPDLRASVYPQGGYGEYADPIWAPVWLYGLGTEICLWSGYDWEITLHPPYRGGSPAFLEARILVPPPVVPMPHPWSPPPQYVAVDPRDEVRRALAPFEQGAVREHARSCVAHILEMRYLQVHARAMWPTEDPQVVLGKVPARSPSASGAGSEGSATSSSGPGSTLAESTNE